MIKLCPFQGYGKRCITKRCQLWIDCESEDGKDISNCVFSLINLSLAILAQQKINGDLDPINVTLEAEAD